MRLITENRSVVVAADVDGPTPLRVLGGAVKGVPGISAFKLGCMVGLDGLRQAVGNIGSSFGETIFVYDHQKAGTDIPEMGGKFARKVKLTGCDAAILFPFAGPQTQETWTKACQDAGLEVIVGGVMTHPQFLISEGGYIDDTVPDRIFNLACEQGVTNFVVPGTKLDWVIHLHGLLAANLGEDEFDLWAPGFISQGGDITDCGRAAGSRFHAIVGSAIYGKDRLNTYGQAREAAMKAVSQLVTAT